MTRMNSQTKIIVATACALAVVDIAVRLFAPTRTVVVREGGLSADTLTVRSLRIVDNDNQPRVTITVDENGEPGMVMRDRNGVNRVQLDTWQNTPSLILNTQSGDRSVYFGMDNSTGQGLYQTSGQSAPVIEGTSIIQVEETPSNAGLRNYAFSLQRR